MPRYRWWSVPAVGVIWTIIVSTEAEPGTSLAKIWIPGLFFGAANAAVGVALSWGLIWAIQALSKRLKSQNFGD